jgi:hypothetical protein
MGSLSFVSRLHTCSRYRLELWLQRSPPRLFTAAAWSGLRSAPESRFRGVHPHLLHSFTTYLPPFWLSLQHTGPQIPIRGRSGGFIALTSRRRGALAGMMAAGAQVLRLLILAIAAIFRPKALLIAENLCLRQQLVVVQRRHPRPRLRDADRRF